MRGPTNKFCRGRHRGHLMTEEEWLACEDSMSMLLILRDRASGRKVRLFAVACCRHVWEFLTYHQSRELVEFFELHVETGPKGKRGFPALRKGASDAFHAASGAKWNSTGDRAKFNLDYAKEYAARSIKELNAVVDAEAVRRYAAEAARWGRQPVRPQGNPLPGPESAEQAILLRDIFGNPFRPATFSSDWRTSTTIALASQMYESRDFSAMPILADALQDAGCADENILSHCREEGPHVRGCWVVDLVLGKG